MNNEQFIKKIESMVKPIDTATLQLVAPLIKHVPSIVQNKLIEKSAANNPYMAFIVDPYSTFLFYEIVDFDMAKHMLPDGYKPIKTKTYEDSEPKYYAVFGSFNVRTSAFSGARLEVKIVAENNETGLLSWVIIDYESNTLSHDQLNGVVKQTTEKALYTINHEMNIIADFENSDKDRALIFNANLQNAKEKKMAKRLWVEGNISIGYGRIISQNSSQPFSLKFNPKQVEKAYQIPLSDLQVIKNSWFTGLFSDEPVAAVCFPYAQHYLSDSPGYHSNVKDIEDMVEQYENLDLTKMPDYSAKPLRKMFRSGIILNSLLLLILLLFPRKK